MSSEAWIFLAVAAVLYLATMEGPAVKTGTSSDDELPIPDDIPDPTGHGLIGSIAVETAQAAGVSPDIFLGIIDVESRWNANATNLTGPDAARGGAWGLTQLTLKTAQALEPGITGEELLDPVTHLRVAGKLLADNARRSTDDRDTAAMWNSGRLYNDAPTTTRNKYVPDVLAAASKYEVG